MEAIITMYLFSYFYYVFCLLFNKSGKEKVNLAQKKGSFFFTIKLSFFLSPPYVIGGNEKGNYEN